MFQADPRGVLALVAIGMCWALAVVLYRVGAPGSVARKLSLVLVVEGVTLASSSAVEFFLISPAETYRLHPEWATVMLFVHAIGDSAMLALYPPFLAAALQTKLTRPFADKRIRIGITAIALVLCVTVILGVFQIGGSLPYLAVGLLYLVLALVFGFALVASIHAWHTATGEARVRARVFALAFGFRDVCWGFIYAMMVRELLLGSYQWITETVSPLFIVFTLGTLFAVPLIAYGILRAQLFDIDLRIRWTIKQSTLAAAVLALVFILSEGADRLLSSELGNFAGLFAAALVVFFLAPLQRFAERVASVAMPNTHSTPEYAAYRKMQVYEASVAEAQQDGGISPKERVLLNRLRDSLGISPADAETLERELQARGVTGAVAA